jgi:hypothetical protein
MNPTLEQQRSRTAMSELKNDSFWESLIHELSSDDEDPPMAEVLADRARLAIGDRFNKRGRRVIAWKIDAIAHPPRVGPIVTFAEIDGTARVQVHVSDIFEKGFSRAEIATFADHG